MKIGDEITVIHVGEPARAHVTALHERSLSFGFTFGGFAKITMAWTDEGVLWARGWGDDITAELRAGWNLSQSSPRRIYDSKVRYRQEKT